MFFSSSGTKEGALQVGSYPVAKAGDIGGARKGRT